MKILCPSTHTRENTDFSEYFSPAGKIVRRGMSPAQFLKNLLPYRFCLSQFGSQPLTQFLENLLPYSFCVSCTPPSLPLRTKYAYMVAQQHVAARGSADIRRLIFYFFLFSFCSWQRHFAGGGSAVIWRLVLSFSLFLFSWQWHFAGGLRVDIRTRWNSTTLSCFIWGWSRLERCRRVRIEVPFFICLCVCVCVCVYGTAPSCSYWGVLLYIYMYICTYACVYMHAYVHTCMHTYIHTCMHTPTCFVSVRMTSCLCL